MLAGVVTRVGGTPWGHTGMSSATWLTVPVQHVDVADLTATQPGVLFAGLIEDRPPAGGDPYPHVIAWGGRHYLEDGHHRVIRWALAGRTSVPARVLDLAARRAEQAGDPSCGCHRRPGLPR